MNEIGAVINIIKYIVKLIRIGAAQLRGCFYIIRYSTFNKRINIRYPFRAYAPVSIYGPGEVSIEKGCSVYENVFVGLNIITLNRNAKVSIGKGCGLSGLTIRCRNRVTIGKCTITAVSLIQDTMLVNRDQKIKNIRNMSIEISDPIVIGDNVWIGAYSCILGGSNIGDDCVIALNSVSMKRVQRAYTFSMGNPVMRDLPIEKLLGLR